jgi:hypothetical protein
MLRYDLLEDFLQFRCDHRTKLEVWEVAQRVNQWCESGKGVLYQACPCSVRLMRGVKHDLQQNQTKEIACEGTCHRAIAHGAE